MKKVALLLAIFAIGLQAVLAQTKEITGTVTSADDGGSIPGVSVSVKGTTLGTITDLDGKYVIKVPQDAKTLVFSFVGMQAKEAAITGNTINVEMEADVVGLSEVVVTAFGISREKKALGYASTEVSSDELLQKSETDMLRAIDGKIAGVEIRSSGGAPGSAARITIRGNTSFSGDNQPLIVVDGIPYSNDFVSTTSMSTSGGAYGNGLGTLDPNDIESTTILKGAAAAALYGSRAKNGVVLIKTKSGSTKAKAFSITINSSVNIEKIASLPDYQNTYGNGSEFNYSNSNGSWGPAFASLDSIATWPGYSAAFGWGSKIPYEAQPNNVKDLFDTGVSYDNSVNISGGTEQSSFNLTLSDSRNDGYIPYSEFNRSSVSIGGSTKMWDKLTTSGTLSYSQTDQTGSIFGNNQSTDGYAASSFARALWLGRTWIMDPYENPVTGAPMQPNGDQFDNPLWSWKHNQILTDMKRIVGNVSFVYDVNDWFNISYRFGFNNFRQDRSERVDIGSRATEFGKKGGITEDNYEKMEIESQLFLNFDRKINEDFKVSGLVGLNHNQRKTDRQAYRGYTFVVPGIYDIDNTEDVITYGGDFTKRRLMGLLGEATVSYKDYAFLTVRGRNDWSSTLPEGNNSYFYPAFDGALIFTDALNIESDVLSFGKIRASWGKVGMDADPYMVYDTYSIGTPFMGQSFLYTPDVAYDPNLGPEYKEDIEVGTELNFFKDRIHLDLAVYKSLATDQIYPVFIPASSGYTQTYTNVGELENKGIEIALDTKNIDSKDFKWSTKITYTANKNKVNDINGVDSLVYVSQLFGDPASALIVGKPYGVFYGSQAARDDNGNLLIDPSSGLIIEAEEQGVVGDPNPEFMLGVSNSFKYKGFTLSCLVDLKYGGDIYSNSIVSLLGRGVTKDTEDRERTMVIPGVYGNSTTIEPILDGNNTIPNTTQVSYNDLFFSSGFSSFAINSYSEFQVYDATTFRLREISLGYDLPKQILKKTPFSSVNFSISGRNLWYWTPIIPKYLIFDPDVSTYGASNVLGVEYSGAPSTRRYGFNVRIVF